MPSGVRTVPGRRWAGRGRRCGCLSGPGRVTWPIPPGAGRWRRCGAPPGRGWGSRAGTCGVVSRRVRRRRGPGAGRGGRADRARRPFVEEARPAWRWRILPASTKALKPESQTVLLDRAPEPGMPGSPNCRCPAPAGKSLEPYRAITAQRCNAQVMKIVLEGARR